MTQSQCKEQGLHIVSEFVITFKSSQGSALCSANRCLENAQIELKLGQVVGRWEIAREFEV